MQMPWEDFAADIIEKLNIGWIVCGHDFTFGHKGQGNAVKLKAYCEERGIGVDIISAVQIEDLTVSSTHIRTLVAEGNMEEARRYLGHPHCLVDTVHSGYHLGTKMGTPTINMRFPDGVIIPRHGVYAAKVYLEDGTSHVAVTNIGVRPTVSDENTVSVESHLLDYSGNLYGSQARVEFYSFIRPEMKFADFRELGEQIKRDAETAREYFKKNS
jgi:riboflavin kinase/FMN adenylyltransferase